MTWLIVAHDASGAFGVAVASRFFAVGALCPHILSGCGALSTQALVNPLYGPDGLSLLRDGVSAPDVVAALTAADEGRDHRQLHVIDGAGRSAAFTGSACIAWCGHACGQGYSVAEANHHLSLAERLLAALDAGEAAGGDKRGKQAAALLIHTDEAYSFLDLRVDDHPEPLIELRRLYEKSLERYQAFLGCLPGRDRAAGITDRAEIEAAIVRFNLARQAQ